MIRALIVAAMLMLTSPALAEIKAVGDDTFIADVVEASREKPVAVFFWAEWCGPCKMMRPGVDKVAGEIGDGLTVVALDVDRAPNAPYTYGVPTYPTIVVFRDGEALPDRLLGAGSETRLRDWLSAYAN